MWLPHTPRTSEVPVQQAQPHSLSSQSLLVEPQKGQEVSPAPAEGCRSAIPGAHTALLLPLKTPCFALLGGNGPPKGHISSAAQLVLMLRAQAQGCGLRPSAQLAWGLDPPLGWWGAGLRAASKADSKCTGALGLSPDPRPSISLGGAWSLCFIQPLHVLINSHYFLKFQWCRLSWTALPGGRMGARPGGRALGVHRTGTLERAVTSSALCVGCTASQQRAGASLSTSRAPARSRHHPGTRNSPASAAA
ncbi:hypothetical protein HJG60_012072 [Phyllostomus discolor]|uniref:Uncharacterized protein n=1 Tax=Phyllostomus discolor TaxID=89673 RepID=A0A833ZJD5_9CHIR|nr:hypothetical protein HJG60_012072 [Phyllostomus discolor]